MEKIWIFLLIAVLTIGSACTQSRGTAARAAVSVPEKTSDLGEMYRWYPPDEEELEERRRNQEYLDAISAELERLFSRYADILADEIILENLIRGYEPYLAQMEAGLTRQEEVFEQKMASLKKELQELESALETSKQEIGIVRQKIEAGKFNRDDYLAAIRLFRDGEYVRSLAKFRQVLKTRYPTGLHDNILFGMASNYFKLRKFKSAAGYLETIIKRHKGEDKWLVSHAMLGAVYDLQGFNSKAVYILEQGLAQNPNPELRSILERLLKTAEQGGLSASS